MGAFRIISICIYHEVLEAVDLVDLALSGLLRCFIARSLCACLLSDFLQGLAGLCNLCTQKSNSAANC